MIFIPFDSEGDCRKCTKSQCTMRSNYSGQFNCPFFERKINWGGFFRIFSLIFIIIATVSSEFGIETPLIAKLIVVLIAIISATVT